MDLPLLAGAVESKAEKRVILRPSQPFAAQTPSAPRCGYAGTTQKSPNRISSWYEWKQSLEITQAFRFDNGTRVSLKLRVVARFTPTGHCSTIAKSEF